MRKLPAQNLGTPVLIQGKSNNIGSGFYVETSDLMLVTAAHVLYDGKVLRSNVITLRSYGNDPADLSPNVIEADLSKLAAAGHIRSHGEHDVVVVRLGKKGGGSQFNIDLFDGVHKISGSKSRIVSVPLTAVKRIKNVLVGNDVVVYGYPASIGMPYSNQFNFDRPLIRKGLVAGIHDSRSTIVLDCMLFPGNSGGPVIELASAEGTNFFNIIGVIIEYIPVQYQAAIGTVNANSGYSVAAPMDAVIECIGKF